MQNNLDNMTPGFWRLARREQGPYPGSVTSEQRRQPPKEPVRLFKLFCIGGLAGQRPASPVAYIAMSVLLEMPEVRQRLSRLSVEEYHRLGEFNGKGRRHRTGL